MLRARLTVRQPAWCTEAERIEAVQKRVQAVSPALLQAVGSARASFVLRELQPTEDRLHLPQSAGKLADLEAVVGTMGQLAAWGQLRSSGRQGSAVADELMAFAHRHGWRGRVLKYAESYGHRVQRDWRAFRAAMDDGALP